MGKSHLKDLIPDHTDSDTVSITEAILLLLRHSGIMSCRLTPAKDLSLPVPRSLLLAFLDNCCSILEYCLNNKQIDNCLSILITLEVCLYSVCVFIVCVCNCAMCVCIVCYVCIVCVCIWCAMCVCIWCAMCVYGVLCVCIVCVYSVFVYMVCYVCV